ncbi:hypothetical protein XU18_3719 [Perkinsela sp. CCAP 1560/4]|nr:hypothetical protein XU18_3719 [Perkinsela sp. CCAP 1560/4]|eukprot:KNH05235.1 hypothetical protein XU18_3719 [Perkinsela sp. CCAP 1560/4]
MFTGSIDLEKLPERMEYLCVSEKCFCGSLDLWSLPKAMTISMNDHKVSGNVDFTRLPAVLVRLSLSANQLSGPSKLSSCFYFDVDCIEEICLIRQDPSKIRQ